VKGRVIAVAAALVTLAVVPATIAAPNASARSAAGCSKWKATVSEAAAANVVDYDFTHGYTTDPNAHYGDPLQGTRLVRGHAYQVTGGNVVVKFGQVRFTVSDGTFFSLSCSGQVRGGPLFPTLYLASGKIKVADPARVAGAVSTFEGLYGPVPGMKGRLIFTVSRVPAKPLEDDLKSIFLTSFYLRDSVRGTTSAVVNGGAPLVNVTPYVGPGPGTCRHCHGARLSSVGKGSAQYFGKG
jgi:hypothetical protein